MEDFITLHAENIDKEHICCAISDKKCQDGYEQKKAWLKKEFENGYVFRRLDARAKVFMEYGPAEKAWLPVNAPNYLMINCFWVSGQYKGKGYAKELLRLAIEDAKTQGRDGLVTVVGNSKFHFMSDGAWLLRQGFEICEKLSYGFNLLVLKINPQAANPTFKECVKTGRCQDNDGLVVYYSARCPFPEFHITTSLTETARKRNLPLKAIKLDSMDKAQAAPTPATIFSIFYNGQFVTTDISVCLDNRFDKVMGK